MQFIRLDTVKERINSRQVKRKSPEKRTRSQKGVSYRREVKDIECLI